MTVKFVSKPGDHDHRIAQREEIERKYGPPMLRTYRTDDGCFIMEGNAAGLLFIADDILDVLDETRPRDSRWLAELYYWPAHRTHEHVDWPQLTDSTIDLMILMFPPTVRLEVFEYEPEPFSGSIQPDWDAGSEMETELYEPRFTITPNQPAAVSFARHLISLAQPDVPAGIRIRFEDPSVLEAKSVPFAVKKATGD